VTDLRRIDVNLIVVLDAILREKNLTHAGDAVGMSQPAVSGALARLRVQFDDPLMVRNGKIFEPTAKALELMPLVEEVMREIERIFDILPAFDPQTSTRTFYIEASDYLLAQITGPLIRLIKQDAPNVNISFDAMPAELGTSQIDLLRRDMIISAANLGIAGKRKSLFSDTFVCIADANNPRIVDGSFTLIDLAELRHCSVSFGSDIMSLIDLQLLDLGIIPKSALRVRGFLPVPFAIAGSELIGFVPERVANRFMDQLGLVIVKTPVPNCNLIEAAFWHPSKSGDPGLTWLTEMLRKAAEIVEFGNEDFDNAESPIADAEPEL
jgi:LysR family nod box-dependent transcriptional activator